MKILVAEDNEIVRTVTAALLRCHGHEVEAVSDGNAAWDSLRRTDGPKIALLDWMMPERNGVDICRGLRSIPELAGRYLILLTSRDTPEFIVEGLQAGANDYVTKPFNKDELLARVGVAAQMVRLQTELTARVCELEEALANVKQLQGLLPICSYCKSVRDDRNYWRRVEDYLSDHADVRCSHGVCPKCWDTVVKRQFAEAGIPLPEFPIHSRPDSTQ